MADSDTSAERKARSNERRRRWAREHPERFKAHQRAWKERLYADPERAAIYRAKRRIIQNGKYHLARARKLMKCWGLTVDHYQRILASQNGVCAICHKLDPNGRDLAVDHDHDSGKVRGLLCRPCNTGLGLFGDGTAGLERALNYLKGLHHG